MIDERDATRKWRTLFHGSSVTPQTMVDAAALLE